MIQSIVINLLMEFRQIIKMSKLDSDMLSILMNTVT